MGGELVGLQSMRCPFCEVVSVESIQDGSDVYFICQNPKCRVNRIYGPATVMLTKSKNIILRKSNDTVVWVGRRG